MRIALTRGAAAVAGGAGWMRDRFLVGLSRVCLEALAFASWLRAFRPRLPAFPGVRLRRRTTAVAASPPASARWGRWPALALDAALLGTTVYMVILVHRHIYAQTQELPSYRARVEDLRLVHRPTWSPRETLTVAVPLDASLADRARGYGGGLIEEVGLRLARDPWVRRVVQVRRVYPHRIEAQVELRRPLAYVVCGGARDPGPGRRGAYVDDEGVRLPDFQTGGPWAAGCVDVEGVDAPPPAPGDAWLHPGVQGALEVAEVLQRDGVARSLLIARIDVSNIGGRRDPRESEIFLWTASGVPVAWGRPPTSARFGENLVDLKMKHLALALESFPGLQGLERVDLRFDRVVVRPRPEWRGLVAADTPVRRGNGR